MQTEYAGIDYGFGRANIGTAGIRYGVISQNAVLQAWCDSSEPYYIYTCPYCGSELRKGEDAKRCNSCYKAINSESDFMDMEPASFVIEDGEYIAESDSQGDIFITKSPYYTYAQFCSPCAPGACHLENPLTVRNENNRCYCFGHDFFDVGTAPYTVYDVKTGKVVLPAVSEAQIISK